MAAAVVEQKKEVDISLQAYDADYCPRSVGIRNIGNTCFMNAIVQALLSITSIFKTAKLKCDTDNIRNNPVLQLLVRMHSGDGDINSLVQSLYREMIGKSINRSDLTRMHISAQEDSYEMFLYILEELCRCPDIDILFTHRTATVRKCLKNNCEHVSTTRDVNQMFIIEADMKVEYLKTAKDTKSNGDAAQELNDFIKSCVSCVPDFKCTACGDKGMKPTITRVTMIPEVICVVFKKYFQKRNTPFPMKLKFSDIKKAKNYIYELIAQVEHSGTQGGGHYKAICKRSEGWKLLDDSYVADAAPGPTSDTYMVFYHYVGDEYP